MCAYVSVWVCGQEWYASPGCVLCAFVWGRCEICRGLRDVESEDEDGRVKNEKQVPHALYIRVHLE